MSDDLARLIVDLEGLPGRVADIVEPGMEKSALEVKRLMQADLKRSTHFNQIARTGIIRFCAHKRKPGCRLTLRDNVDALCRIPRIITAQCRRYR